MTSRVAVPPTPSVVRPVIDADRSTTQRGATRAPRCVVPVMPCPVSNKEPVMLMAALHTLGSLITVVDFPMGADASRLSSP